MNGFLKGSHGDGHAGQPKFKERLLLFGYGCKNDSRHTTAETRLRYRAGPLFSPLARCNPEARPIMPQVPAEKVIGWFFHQTSKGASL
jgi:hypothetical protein